jgi:hypothetical protein
VEDGNMSRPPQYDISLDLLPRPASLEDYTAGDAAIVRTIEARQHALVCGWGAPPQVVTLTQEPVFYLGTETQSFLLRVPPYCKRMRVAVLVWGGSYFAPHSDEGFVLQVGALAPTSDFAVDANSWVEAARWEEGSTSPSSVGNLTQCLEVLGSAVPSWSTVTVTISYGQYWYGQLLGLAFYPVLEQAV